MSSYLIHYSVHGVRDPRSNRLAIKYGHFELNPARPMGDALNVVARKHSCDVGDILIYSILKDGEK